MDCLQNCVNSANKGSGYCFGLKHVVEIVAQLKSEDTSPTGIETLYGRRASLLGRRLNEDMDSKLRYFKKIKSQSTCMASDNVGHWYQDPKECQEKMRAKRKEHALQPAQDDPAPENEKSTTIPPFHVEKC